jgi:hypothetical protein
MADDTPTPSPSAAGGGTGRGGRPPGNRDAGGFRIRLSDNELQAARALQEAFGLRSTVAVLGFALRTLAQQLEQGQLEELLAQHRAQAGSRGAAPRGDDRRRESSPVERGGGGGGGRVQRVDPFARPSRPGPPPVARDEQAPTEDAEIASEAELTQDTAVETDTAVAMETAVTPPAAEHPDSEVEQEGADPQITPA